jgi:hypothetical protein
VLHVGDTFPFLGLTQLLTLIVDLPRRRHGREHVADEGLLRHDPSELDESARVDGATPAQVFWGIVLPLAAPVLAVIALISFVTTLNEYVIASTILQTTHKYTLPLGLYQYIDQKYGSTGARSPPACLLARVPGGPPVRVPAALHRPGPDRRRGQGMSALAEPRTSLLDEPHHDGSELGVLERPEQLGGEATVRLRVPRAAGADAVVLRYVRDGEPHAVRAELDGESEAETWWRASFPSRTRRRRTAGCSRAGPPATRG